MGRASDHWMARLSSPHYGGYTTLAVVNGSPQGPIIVVVVAAATAAVVLVVSAAFSLEMRLIVLVLLSLLPLLWISDVILLISLLLLF